MSAKLCQFCSGPIVFGKDQDTGQVIPLSVGSRVYRVVKDNIVTLDSKALIRHVCITPKTTAPSPARDFNEPKEQDEPDTLA